jgi:mono/diheme cytochrome c family protein
MRSRTAEKVPANYLVAKNERLLAVAQGDQLMEYFNCKGCHVIDGQGGLVRDSYLEDDLYKAPPILQQEGWRVQPEWLFGFLRDPSQKLRPWLDIRMPTFPLGDDRRTNLVRAFAARSNVIYPYLSVKVEAPKGKELQEVKAMVNEQLSCFKCHTAGEAPPDQDKASLAPNLELAKYRLRPDWVEAWLRNPQSLQEGTRMPNFFTPDNFDQVMYPNYFGGSQERQIKALRDYVMTLPDTPPGKPQAKVTTRPQKKKR